MSWICHQLGSREHYSIPRALNLSRQLKLLQTDAWITPKWQCLLKAFKQYALASRFHPDLVSTQVKAFTLERVSFDLLAKIYRKDPWCAIAQRDLWFQTKCLPELEQSLEGEEEHFVFSYAYTARQLFKAAKRKGATCVLGQVDPGPGELAHLRSVLPSQIASKIEDRPESYWDAWREEIALADRILVNSSWSKELLIKFSEVPQEKIKIIPLAYTPESVEAPKQYPARFTKDRPLKLLFLGQVIHRKGVHLLLEAMERLADHPVTLDLVGPIDPSTFDARLLPASQVSGLRPHPSNRLHVHGPVDRECAKQLYREADVFILPTLSDGFALTQLEAAAHRLPLISSRFCGRVVQHEINGLLLDEVRVDLIEQAILRCLEHPKELTKWSAHQLDWREYSLERLGERLQAMATAPACQAEHGL